MHSKRTGIRGARNQARRGQTSAAWVRGRGTTEPDVTSACWILFTGDTKSGYVTLGMAIRPGQGQVSALGRVAGPCDRGAVGGVRLGPAAQPPQQVGADRV